MFSATGITTVFTNLEGFPEDWKKNPEAFIKFVRDHQCPELPGVRRVSLRHRRRDQEGAAVEGGLLGHARPDAVTGASARNARTRRHPAHPADPHAGDDRPLRVPVLRHPAGGRAWLSELLDPVQSAADARRHDGQLRSAGSRWRSPGMVCGRSACPRRRWPTFPDEFREGMAARADILGDTGANAPEHWVGGLAGDDLHAIAILFARDDERAPTVPSASTTSCSPAATGCAVCRYLDLNATPPFNYAHDHFGFRDRLSQPVMKGSGEEPTPGFRRAAGAGRVHPRLSRRVRAGGESPCSPRCCRATAATWRTGDCRSTSACSATILREQRGNTGRAGTAGGEVHGPLAQRRAARAGTGHRRSRTRRRSRCATTTSTTRRWIRTGTRARWARMPAGSIRATPRTT